MDENDNSKIFGARIVVQTQMNDNIMTNRKLYIPPQLREEDEMNLNDLNDISHDLGDNDNDTISGCALFIDGFRRPLQLRKVESALREFGTYKAFKMNAIKSHCYVIFDDIETANKCKAAMHAMYFPQNIPQIHAGKLSVKNVKMMEAMSFIQGMKGNGTHSRVISPRSFETKRNDINIKKGKAIATDNGVKEMSKKPSELFNKTSNKPYIFSSRLMYTLQNRTNQISFEISFNMVAL